MSNLKVNTINDANGGSAAVLYGVASPPNSMGFRNRIINGDMRIDQRNNGASVTPISAGYTLDRWQAGLSVASKFSVQQNAGAITPPVGFTKYLGCTSLSAYSVGSSESFRVQQAIEGLNVADLAWGTANAQAVTVSFWVRSSLTGAFGGSVYNVSGTRSYPFSYTISAANNWEQKTIIIAGDTTGTWPSDNTAGLYLAFSLGAGATASGTAGTWANSFLLSATGATSVVGTSGATFYITGVQLEAGSVASPFERRDYGRELMMCQRYFYRKNFTNTVVAVAVLQAYAGGNAYGKLFDLPVTPRTTPTFSFSSIGHFRPSSNVGGTLPAFTAGFIDGGGFETASTQGLSGSSGMTAGNATVITVNTASAYIEASMEL